MAENPRVVLQTNLGDIVLELLPEKAPITVDNFLQYVEEGFYDNTVFHRVIKGFMIQGGGFDASGNRKEPRAPIKNEADNGLQNNLGTIAMARTPQKDSATSQFFINVTNNTFLNHGKRNFGYCVFGHLVSGLDVVRKIENTPTTIEKGMKDWPQEDIIIQKAYLVLNEETLPEK